MSKVNFLFLILLFSFQNLSYAQNNKLITGRVIDNQSKQPIANVELFISGTTIGTTTNQDGEFSIKTDIVPCHLVVMHVSYESLVLPTGPAEEITIELPRLLHGVNEVSVKGKNMRRRNLRMFYTYFLWNTNNQQVKVLNDSVLKFKRDEDDFHAYCTSPLLVKNKYLGYDMKILIQDFHVCSKLLSTGEKVKLNAASSTAVFKLKGYHYYQEAEINNPQKKKLVNGNRKSHYYGSLRHFLTSLYQDELSKNDFHLSSKGNAKHPFILTKINKNFKRFKFGSDKVIVKYYEDPKKQVNLEYGQYYYQKTSFLSLKKEFEIRPNGTSPELLFELRGSMAQTSPANTLPDDYLPKL